MTHSPNESWASIRCRWQNEQQLIRKKYRIPYNTAYTSARCVTSYGTAVFSHARLPGKREKKRANDDPPMRCTRCDEYPTKCSCSNGLGRWWANLQRRSSSVHMPKKASMHFFQEQNVQVDPSSSSSSADLTSMNAPRSNEASYLFAVVDRANRQSVQNFIRTLKVTENLSTMTDEQLNDILNKHGSVKIVHSLVDLGLAIDHDGDRSHLCQTYIDPSFYSSVAGRIPFSQSRLVADNFNLTQALHSIDTLCSQLGVNIDRLADHSLSKEIAAHAASKKTRHLILQAHSQLLASQMPHRTGLPTRSFLART